MENEERRRKRGALLVGWMMYRQLQSRNNIIMGQPSSNIRSIFLHNSISPMLSYMPDLLHRPSSPRNERLKSVDYWTRVFPNLQDDWSYNSFRRHFRISRATFHYLVDRLSFHPKFANTAPNATPV